MKTNDKVSDLINQAITNLPGGSVELANKLWECMKEASFIEMEDQLKFNREVKRVLILELDEVLL